MASYYLPFFYCRVLRIEFNHSLIEYYTGIDGVLLNGIKVPIDQTVPKGAIQRKLETVHFKLPQKAPSESIEDFLKNDLSRFIVGFPSSSEKNNQTIPIIENEKTISDLPYEVLFDILSYLDLRSLYRVSQVAKIFQQIANDPLLYLNLNLKFYWNHANSSLVESLARRACLIRKLDMSCCGLFESITPKSFINFISTNGKSITHLRMNSSHFLNTSCLETVGKNCYNLKELSIKNLLNDCDFISLSLLTKLLVLDLSRTSINSVALLQVLKNNLNLEKLSVAFLSQSINLDEICSCIANYNRKIKNIDFWKAGNHLSSTGIRELSKCTLLEELDVGWCLREGKFQF